MRHRRKGRIVRPARARAGGRWRGHATRPSSLGSLGEHRTEKQQQSDSRDKQHPCLYRTTVLLLLSSTTRASDRVCAPASSQRETVSAGWGNEQARQTTRGTGCHWVQLIRTYRYDVSTASHRCSQSPSHSQIVLYERDWMIGRNSCLSFDTVHSTGRLDWIGDQRLSCGTY